MRWKTWAAVAALGAVTATAHAQLKTQVLVTGLSLPVAMVQDPTNPNVQFVVQQRGRIRVISGGVLQGTDFLDLTGIASTSGNERGLLGLAFHPQYGANRQFFVNYTDTAGNTKIRRYHRNAANPLLADPGTAYDILSVAQPFSNHNGGSIRFSTDGFLYIGLGDGGSGNDPGNRAQQITGQLLGKMLRLDIDSDAFPKDPLRNYAIPNTNPFVGITGDDEIWALGLRNPWKFTFDDPTKLGTGAMVIGDVGQNAWEEIDYEPALAGGRNYGWRVREGFTNTGLSGGGNSVPFTDPIYVYPRTVGQSITGGYVYRGTMLGDLFGRYFYADYVSGRVFSIQLTINPGTGEATASNLIEHTADLGLSGMNISSIDVDSDGEMYLVDYFGGRILKVLPENAAWITGHGLELRGPSSGTVRHLSAVDGKVFWLAQQNQIDSVESNGASMRVEFQTDLAALSSLDFFIDMRMAHPGTGFLRVAFYNWTASRWEVANTFILQTAMQTYSLSGVPAAAYRRADGRIHMNIRPWKPGGLNVDPLSHYIDRVKVVPH